MQQTYKPSMFNYICSDEKNLILYNSFLGSNSIIKINENEKSKIEHLLKKKSIEEKEICDRYSALIEKGFFVGINENEKMKREYLFTDMVFDNSLDLVITVTEKCNFACVYCSLDFVKGKMSLETQNDIVSFIKKNISKYKRMRVEWFGGEPLLCMDVISNLSEQFIDICRKAKKGYSAAITTNGYLLNLKNFNTLLDSKVLSYQITLDGLRENHDQQRWLANKKGTFEVILNNLLAIKQEVKNHFFRINIRTNFTKKIAEHMDDYLNFYESNFMDDDRFVFFVRAAGDWGGDRVKSFHGLLNSEEENSLMEHIFNQDTKLNFAMNYSFLEPGRTVCHAANKNMFNIGSDGKLYKCDSSIELACIGRIASGGNLIIDEYKQALWTTGTRYTCDECDDCFFSCSCIKGACPLDIIRGNDPKIKRCSFEKENLEYLLKQFVKTFDVIEI